MCNGIQTQSNKLLNEDDICQPVNPYGNNKLTIEGILEDIYKSEPSQWRIASLRYFNPVGATNLDLLERTLGIPNNLYPLITQVAIGKIKNKIFGSDWQTNDGTGVRDYIHVLDLAEGHLLTLDYILKENLRI